MALRFSLSRWFVIVLAAALAAAIAASVLPSNRHVVDNYTPDRVTGPEWQQYATLVTAALLFVGAGMATVAGVRAFSEKPARWGVAVLWLAGGIGLGLAALATCLLAILMTAIGPQG
jgi:hypothetical protein